MSETTSPSVEVTYEPLTYERHAPASYFRDLALREHRGDNASSTRLARHAKEMTVELPRLEERARRATREHGIEYRTNPTSTSSTFAPPLWVIEEFATAPRAKRVLANLVNRFPLPRGAHSINLPRLTTGTQVLAQQDGMPVQDRDVVDAASQSVVTTLAGQSDASLQLLEQSPPGAHLDWALFKDLSESFDKQLEVQMLNGTGSGENLLGVLNAVPAANQVTYTDASPAGSKMFPFIGQLVALIGDNRMCPPEYLLMRTARWAWLGTQEDSQNRPLLLADWGPQGQGILTFPTEFDDAIPSTLGTAANQDAIIACRPSDMMLWEGAHHTSVMFDVLSGTLQARFQLHGSVAFIVRYPSGQSSLTGTGMVPPSGF